MIQKIDIMFIVNWGLCSITLCKLFYGQLGLVAVAIGLFLYRGLYVQNTREHKREKNTTGQNIEE